MLERMLLSAGADDKLFVEDVFSTYLYTGTGAAQTITNGIDTLGNGGMVWLKGRDSAQNNILFDTAQGCTFAGGKAAISNLTNAGITIAANTFKFDSTGFSFGTSGSGGALNGSGINYASWTFREAPKFFDVVTWTGTGADRNIAHNLGIAPGCVIIKRTDTTGDWWVYHRSIPSYSLKLNSTAAQVNQGGLVATSTTFTLYDNANVNASGGTYVAYVYAHDASSDGLIQCGAAAAGTDINLGWEPQFVIIKKYDGAQIWIMNDNMRGMSVGGNTAADLYPHAADAEVSPSNNIFISATGFKINLSQNYIYMAIRRGPMRTPTLGTSVFAPIVRAGTGAAATVTGVGFPLDTLMTRSRNNGTGISAFGNMTVWDRLRGVRTGASQYLFTNATQEERSISNAVLTLSMDGYSLGSDGSIGTSNYSSSENYINYCFRRAAGFFDEVCYTGTGAVRTVNHNLGVVPELMIVKARTQTGGGIYPSWAVYSQATGNTKALFLDQSGTGTTSSNFWNNTTPTSSVFSVFQADTTNASATNYVAYLFASCPGVSKVGSYTGNGSTQTIDCSFTTGARFVMIKRTDATEAWHVFDTARGINAGNDPAIRINTDSAEFTSAAINPNSSGFIVEQSASCNNNVSGGTYIYLAIA